MAKPHRFENGLARNWLAREVNMVNLAQSAAPCLELWFNFTFAAFMYFTINREPYRNNRQRCLEMLTFS